LTGKVRRLDSALVDQIAAGEVVERPASLVKELVENALDAGATRIRVDVDEGGLALVRVADDGEGMAREDAELALERHATSKIGRFEDLAALHTFGFRGEALPSIASVSRLLLATRARGSSEGVEITIEGGGPKLVRPAGRAEGTTIEVRELFYNVPARRKFLKAPATESAHVGEVVAMAALARPDVTFTLARDGKVAREYLRAADREARARQVITQEPRLLRCLGERGPLKIEAFLGPPERARTGAVALHLFVNGRPIKDRPLARAVAHAYGSVLEPGRYPVGVVWLELPPELVDVNVHPQKSEVRFENGRALFDAVSRELHVALAKAFPIAAPTFGGGAGAHAAAAARFAPGPIGRGAPSSFLPELSERFAAAPERAPSEAPASGPVSSAEGPRSVALPDEAPTSRSSAPDLFEPPGFYRRLRFLAQVRATFLLCEGEDGLYVLDQHAADERRNFARLKRTYEERGVAVQRLLVPEIVEVSPADVVAATENEAELRRLGLEVRAVGAQAIAIDGVPQILRRARPERLLRDVLVELTREGGRGFGDAVDLRLATMACHGSVRAGDPLGEEEVKALLSAMDDVAFSGHCPHGRPVVMRLGFGELERRVGR
jgi:DNA mismatch repair protein MutL